MTTVSFGTFHSFIFPYSFTQLSNSLSLSQLLTVFNWITYRPLPALIYLFFSVIVIKRYLQTHTFICVFLCLVYFYHTCTYVSICLYMCICIYNYFSFTFYLYVHLCAYMCFIYICHMGRDVFDLYASHHTCALCF